MNQFNPIFKPDCPERFSTIFCFDGIDGYRKMAEMVKEIANQCAEKGYRISKIDDAMAISTLYRGLDTSFKEKRNACVFEFEKIGQLVQVEQPLSRKFNLNHWFIKFLVSIFYIAAILLVSWGELMPYWRIVVGLILIVAGWFISRKFEN